MPVTGRFSLRFYERLGEDVAQELVDWINSVDATYRSDLRELNELNFARFDAKMEQRLSEFNAKLEQRLGGLQAELIKWTFIFVAGGTLTILGVLVTLLSR